MTARFLEKTATSGSNEAYRELAPHRALAERVVCVWIDPARPRLQPVLPDACIDLVWDGARLCVAGPDTRAVPIESSESFVGIRFRPGSAPGFLGIGSDALVDARVALADVWGSEALLLEEQLHEQPERAATILQDVLLGRLEVARESDSVVDELVDLLARRTPLRRSVERLDVSERTLRRRCAVALGYGPKTLQRVLRFRRALRLLAAHKSLADAAQLAGYVDQAHLTNESQRLAGLTPAALAGSPTLSISTNGCN